MPKLVKMLFYYERRRWPINVKVRGSLIEFLISKQLSYGRTCKLFGFGVPLTGLLNSMFTSGERAACVC